MRLVQPGPITEFHLAPEAREAWTKNYPASSHLGEKRAEFWYDDATGYAVKSHTILDGASVTWLVRLYVPAARSMIETEQLYGEWLWCPNVKDWCKIGDDI